MPPAKADVGEGWRCKGLAKEAALHLRVGALLTRLQMSTKMQ